MLAGICACTSEHAKLPVPPLPGLHHDSDGEERFEMHLAKSKNRLLRGVTMVAKFAGHLKELDRNAKIEARRRVAPDGSLSYDVLAKEGDTTVQKELIARMINVELDSQNHDPKEVALTPENYKIKYKGVREEGGRKTEFFELHPRHNRIGLFKGEVWVDVETGLSIHEAGVFVKNPSLFVKSLSFQRDYEIHQGFAIPKSNVVYFTTRFWGTGELDVEYSDVAWDAAPATSQSRN
jgi:hypothetical protein